MLIVDNHSSRYNPEMWVDAWEAGVLLQALPPHCTPFMQPLDFGCFGPYKNDVDEYAMQCRVKGHDIGDWNVITILEHGLRSVFTVRRIVAAWLYTGLYPLKRSRIPEHLLSPPAAAFAAAAAADAAGDGSAAAAALRMPNMPDLLRLAMEARPELKEIVHDQSKLRVALEAMKQKRKRKKRSHDDVYMPSLINGPAYGAIVEAQKQARKSKKPRSKKKPRNDATVGEENGEAKLAVPKRRNRAKAKAQAKPKVCGYSRSLSPAALADLQCGDVPCRRALQHPRLPHVAAFATGSAPFILRNLNRPPQRLPRLPVRMTTTNQPRGRHALLLLRTVARRSAQPLQRHPATARAVTNPPVVNHRHRRRQAAQRPHRRPPTMGMMTIEGDE